MKKYLFIALGFFGLFQACQNNETANNADSLALDTNVLASTKQFCYTYIKDRDTANLTFMSSGNITTGELTYRLFEKDRNKGIIKGEMRGDTLVADYTFNSEGIESVRQVAFLKKGDQLLEGYGDVEQKDHKTVFKNISSLSFGRSIIFNKTDCK